MMAVVRKITKKAASKDKSPAAKKTRKKLSSDQIQELIAKKAYEIYEKRGGRHGDDWSDWYEAEKAVMRGQK